MGKNQPKQSPNTKLSLLLQRHLRDKGISSSKLATECSLEPSTISRIINGYGNNGNPYCPTMETIMLITRVLELNEEESRELFFAAFPAVCYGHSDRSDMIITNSQATEAKKNSDSNAIAVFSGRGTRT